MIDKMIINWCPICAKTLGDYNKKTRLEHDKKFHPSYFTSQTGVKRNDLFHRENLK